MMTLKLPRTIRLDPSDGFVFEHAAEPGEWAVTGSFLFWDEEVRGLSGRRRAAFRAGFVGVESLGFSTLVVVTSATAADRERAIAALARHILEKLAAPSLEAARRAAREEVDFAASLCQDEDGTILAMHRIFDGTRIREQFRSLHRRDPALDGTDRLHAHARAFEFVEVEEEPGDGVDLVGLPETKV